MSMYAQLIGEDFASLPDALKVIHARPGNERYRGEVSVVRDTRFLVALCAAVCGLPAPYVGVIDVAIVATAGSEQWTRYFGPHVMRSLLRARDGFLRERLGPVCFDFVLSVIDETIVWRVARLSVLGIPLPVSWFKGVQAIESIRDDRYHFDVRAQLPGVGLLIHYFGWLDVRPRDA